MPRSSNSARFLGHTNDGEANTPSELCDQFESDEPAAPIGGSIVPAPSPSPNDHLRHLTPTRFVLKVLATVFVAEMLVMYVLHVTKLDVPPFVEALIDSAALAGFAGAAIWLLIVRPLTHDLEAEARTAREADASLRTELELREQRERVLRGMEMAQNDAEVLVVVERSVASTLPRHRGELLMADSSDAHLRRELVVGSEAPGCSVVAPRDCPAVREGRPLVFHDPTAIDACPRLHGRCSSSDSALCVPMAILGKSVGVLHAVAPREASVDRATTEQLVQIVSGAGARLGLLRALDDFETQAATDGLTGLANRRTVDNHLSRLHAQGAPWTAVMIDLDHFKNLNDVHGHETGDRALRLFGRVLQDAVRDVDLAARYGGEEFICLIEGGDEHAGVKAAKRVQTLLQEFLAGSPVPHFTISVGVCSAEPGDDPTTVVAQADEALYSAKQLGRNRVEVYRPNRDLTPVPF